jgi:uncharacterized protein (DUF1697 family)
MTVYTALLKGVNVGKSRRIKMEDLKGLFDSLGLLDTQTYIQSGNIVFLSDADEDVLREKIARGIETSFGLLPPVILRTAEELEGALNAFPFYDESAVSGGPEKRHIAFLQAAPSPEALARFDVYQNKNEKYVVRGRDVFLLLLSGVRNSRLAGHLHVLDASATLRNFKTLSVLAKMARSIKT